MPDREPSAETCWSVAALAIYADPPHWEGTKGASGACGTCVRSQERLRCSPARQGRRTDRLARLGRGGSNEGDCSEVRDA